MEQNVKQAGYPDVQSFTKAQHKSEELIREYNNEMREWKKQTAQKKQTSDPPTKASVLKKLQSYQQEGRQQPKRSAKKKSKDMER